MSRMPLEITVAPRCRIKRRFINTDGFSTFYTCCGLRIFTGWGPDRKGNTWRIAENDNDVSCLECLAT